MVRRMRLEKITPNNYEAALALSGEESGGQTVGVLDLS